MAPATLDTIGTTPPSRPVPIIKALPGGLPPLSNTNPCSASPSLSRSSSVRSEGGWGGSSSSTSNNNNNNKKAGVPEFLLKLYRILDKEDSDIISWDHGCIHVKNPAVLGQEILHKYFRHSKYSSFQRQLNYFGFRKTQGKGKMSACTYTNSQLCGDSLSSLLSIKRKTSATTKPGSESDDCRETASVDQSDSESEIYAEPRLKRQRSVSSVSVADDLLGDMAIDDTASEYSCLESSVVSVCAASREQSHDLQGFNLECDANGRPLVGWLDEDLTFSPGPGASGLLGSACQSPSSSSCSHDHDFVFSGENQEEDFCTAEAAGAFWAGATTTASPATGAPVEAFALPAVTDQNNAMPCKAYWEEQQQSAFSELEEAFFTKCAPGQQLLNHNTA